MGDADRQGAVLVVCVLLLLALALLAEGALVMAREELAVSRAGADLLRARAAADAGVADVLHGDGSLPEDSVGRGGAQALMAGALGDVRFRVEGRRLSREVWLVEGSGAARADAWVARSAWPVWVMDPAVRVAAFQGVVEVGQGAPVSGASGVHVRDDDPADPPPDPVACAAWDRARDSLSAVAVPSPVAVVDTSASPAAVGPTEPRLGRLVVGDLLSAADHTVAGPGTPAPAGGAGACDGDAAWNWGDPDAPLAPCHELTPLVGSPGNLSVNGGVGQGVLVVAGDLTLSAGTRFYGLVLVGGGVRVTDGSRVVGLVRAVGGLTVSADAEIDGSRCWAFQALGRNRPALARPRLLPAGRIGPW